MTTEKKSRPYKRPDRRAVAVTVSLEPRQREFLVERAAAEGIPVSEVVRNCLSAVMAAEERG